MSLNSNAQSLSTEGFLQANTAEEVQNYLQKLPAKSIILVDIDDTIIAPKSKTFRTDPSKQLIDKIKANKHLYENYEAIVSNWRLQRKVMLVDTQWPSIINQLKQSHLVYALTKMDSGKFGNIASMEIWRYNELKNLNIEFATDKAMEDFSRSLPGINHPSFYKGIFITGSASKQKTLDQFHSFFNSNSVVLVDDREEQLLDIKQYCQKNNIEFLGILFKGATQLPGIQNPTIAELQKAHLLKHAEWLEDEQAEMLLK